MDLSRLADAVLGSALAHLHAWQSQDLGRPQGPDGQPQTLVVVALGKLGAFELNFSSDVDLVFAVPEQGTVAGGRRELDSQGRPVNQGDAATPRPAAGFSVEEQRAIVAGLRKLELPDD